MNKGLVVLIVLGVALIALLIGLAVVQSKFEAVASAPAISYATVTGPSTSVRILVQPLLASSYIGERVMAPLGAPAWSAPRILPREVAVLCDTSMSTGDAALTFFINEQRFGPIIVDAINKLNVTGALPFIRWASSGMDRRKRGEMLMQGEFSLSPSAVQAIRDVAGVVTVPSALELEGNHFIEAVLDNRDGSAFALINTFYEASNTNPNAFDPLGVVKGAMVIAAVRVKGDMDSPTTMKLQITLEGHPTATEDDLQGIKFFLDQGIGQARKTLKNSYNISLDGGFAQKNSSLVGDFTLTNLDGLLAALGIPVPKTEAQAS